MTSAISEKKAIEIFAEKDKKQKPFQNCPSEAPRKSSGGQHSKFFIDKRYGKSRQKYSTQTITQQLVEAVDSKVKMNTKETFNMLFPPIIPIEDLRNVHPWVKSLFSARKVPNLPLAGKLKNFLEAWDILIKDPEILEIVKGFNLPFLKTPTQERVP